jgi:5-methylcytosine-specific restriction endonuclease McrA
MTRKRTTKFNSPGGIHQADNISPAHKTVKKHPNIKSAQLEPFLGGKCHYCECGLQRNNIAVDHFIPKHMMTDQYRHVAHESNLVPCCRDCHRKHNGMELTRIAPKGNKGDAGSGRRSLPAGNRTMYTRSMKF